MTIRLLVSVRNASETKVAVAGGADIVDVKEPRHGSLGFAGADVLASVIDAVGNQVPVSAAMGECFEWLSESEQTGRSVVLLPPGLQYTKLGLAQLQGFGGDWISHWCRAQGILENANGQDSPRNVAVAYADSCSAEAPSPSDVLNAAVQNSCSVFLIDTWRKDSRTTFDWMTESELCALRSKANDANLLFALAGRLNERHLPAVRNVRPDILGVRGAVCGSFDRNNSLCSVRMTAFRSALDS